MSLNIHEDDLRREGSQIGERIGFEKGILQGKRDGIAEGAYQTKLETARILKQLGDSAQKIMQATGLSIAEINKL